MQTRGQVRQSIQWAMDCYVTVKGSNLGKHCTIRESQPIPTGHVQPGHSSCRGTTHTAKGSNRRRALSRNSFVHL
eukprot:3938424-Prymnesium_polylepis.1